MKVIAPRDVELERQYVTAVYYDQRLLDRTRAEHSHLTDPWLALLLRGLTSMYEAREEINIETLRAWLVKETSAKISDEKYYLWHSTAFPVPNPDTLAPRLRELATSRQLREKLIDVNASIDTGDATDALAKIRAISEIRDPNSSGERATTRDLLIDAVEQAKLSSGGVRFLVPTGLANIDSVTNGMERGDLWVIGGDTNVGKSSVALYMAAHIAKLGTRVGYISCEDPRSRVSRRVMSSLVGVSPRALRTGQIKREEFSRIFASVDENATLPLFWRFCVAPTLDESIEATRSLVRDDGCEVVVLDYLQTIEVHGEKERHLQIRKVLSRFKRELNSAIKPVIGIALSQFRKRDDEHEQPTRYHLYEANYIAQMAEGIVLLWKDSSGVLNGVLDKAKDDETGVTIKLYRDQHGRLTEHEPIARAR